MISARSAGHQTGSKAAIQPCASGDGGIVGRSDVADGLLYASVDLAERRRQAGAVSWSGCRSEACGPDGVSVGDYEPPGRTSPDS